MKDRVNRASLCVGCAQSFEGAGYSVRALKEEAKRRICQICGKAGWFDMYEVFKKRSEREEGQ